MVTETPLRPPERNGAVADRERSTQPLDPAVEPLLDSLSYLDYRSRRRTMLPRYAAPGHYLALSDGEQERLFPLHERIMHVGRSLTSELRFEQSHVSRRHAIVIRYGNHVRILDDRSSGGTWVNEVRVVACDLHSEDVIRLGRITLRYLRVL